MFRTEKKVLISLDGASVATSTVRGVAVMIAKETSASGEEVVDPLGDDNTLSGVKTANGRAMSWPVDRFPETVGPLVAILEMSPEKGGKVCKAKGCGDVAADGAAGDSKRTEGGRDEGDKDCLGAYVLDVGCSKSIGLYVQLNAPWELIARNRLVLVTVDMSESEVGGGNNKDGENAHFDIMIGQFGLIRNVFVRDKAGSQAFHKGLAVSHPFDLEACGE